MHVEKPTGTSAAATAFCADKVTHGGQHLWVDGNGKITAGNGTLEAPRPNAFSLVQVEDCPGATATCKESCYVHSLEKYAPDTHALYRHNSAAIRAILGDPYTRIITREAAMWARAMADYIVANCQGGFRWHVSGDVFSSVYASWIYLVVGMSPLVLHWIYTRSFDYVGILNGVSTQSRGNLVVNLSCDRDNYDEARKVHAALGSRLCYLTRDGGVPYDLPKGSVIFPDYNLRGGNGEGALWFEALPPHQKQMVCPVDYHGKTEERRCGRCRRCMI